jgi:hypothetical protein
MVNGADVLPVRVMTHVPESGPDSFASAELSEKLTTGDAPGGGPELLSLSMIGALAVAGDPTE